MTNEIQTTTIKNGATVLAGKDRYGYFGPKTYTNYTQADAIISKLDAQGIYATVLDFGPVKYIKIN